MIFSKYIRDKVPFIMFNVLVFLFLSIIMAIVSVDIYFILFVAFIWFVPLLIYIVCEFFSKRKFYNDLIEISE